MPKPSAGALTFATNLNYAAGPEPEAGHASKVDPTDHANGFRPDKKPPAENFNYLFNLLGQWTEYVDAGVVDGDLTVDGNLEVTGDAALDGNLTVDGFVTVGDGNYVELRGNDDAAGQIRHGLYHMSFAPIGIWDNTSGGTVAVNANATIITAALSLNGTAMLVPLNGLSPGDRIQKIRIGFTSSGDNIGMPVLRLDTFGATPLTLSLTPTTTETAFGIHVAEFSVDVPTALYLTTGSGTFKFARRAVLHVAAGSNTTVIHAIEALYDRIDITAGA